MVAVLKVVLGVWLVISESHSCGVQSAHLHPWAEAWCAALVEGRDGAVGWASWGYIAAIG